MLGVVSGKLQFLPLKQTQHFRRFAIYDFTATTLYYDREEDVWVVEDKTSLTTAAGGIAVVVLIAATAWR